MYDPKFETKILKFWEENKIFEKRRKKNENNEKWSFIDGPITANFSMGVHTAYSRAIKDLYQRYKGLQGYHQRYQNGFDCHGLPIEVNVEKKEGIDIKKDIESYGLEKFIKKCRQRVEKYSKIQTEESVRLGQWMDWGNDYHTMSEENILHIWYFLKKCHEKKWIKKGTRVLPWCWRCGTSLSQHEVGMGYQELTHEAVFLQLKIKNRENEYLLVWTTTPWTLTSNVAAAVNPDVVYVKAKKNGKVYYLTKATASVLEDYEVLEEIHGSQLVGLEYEGPYDELPAQKDVVHKVIDWNLVGEEDGTGIVHIAPGCGAEDHDLGQELGLAVIAPLDEKGVFIDGFGWLSGKHVEEVADPIIADLEKKGILFKRDKVTHKYPTCWRCNKELVFRLTEEWFIKVDELRPQLITEAEKVIWSPNYGKKMMINWLTNMRDWNISRKRYWGLPLPFWICECGEFEVIGSLGELKKKAVSGTDKLKELHKPWIDDVVLKCSKCGKEMRRTPEVGDCWLDAGIVPYSTLNYLTDRKHWKTWFPSELIGEMKEQVRLWFYSMLFMSVVLEGKTPYKKVLLFEEVRAEDGQPMHKSGENVIWIDDAFEKMGADALRWIYLSTNLTQNINFGYGLEKEARQTLNYFFNISNYISKFLKEPPAEPEPIKPEDRWFLSKLERTKKETTKAMEDLKPYVAAKALEDFFVNTFSKQYIKYIRNRTGEKEVVGIMYRALLDTLKMMAPFTPFLAEEIYQNLFKRYEKEESIHLQNWPEVNEKFMDEELEKQIGVAQNIIEGASNLRNQIGVHLRQPLRDLQIISKEDLPELANLIAKQTNVKEVKFVKKAPDGDYASLEIGGMKLFLNKTIDAELKKEGLTREVTRRIQQMRKEMGLVEKDKIEVNIIGKLDVNIDLIKKHTNSTKLEITDKKALEGEEKKWKIDGEEVVIVVKK